jgi:hypothetical protein
MMKFLRALWHWADPGVDWRLERYLAESIDLADLEHRIKRWDYMTEAERNHWYR